MTDDVDRALGPLLELVVHDLKNPLAAVSANLGFVRAVAGSTPDVEEALEETEAALAQLARGLEHLGWIARWIGSADALAAIRGDARDAVRRGVDATRLDVALELPEEPVQAEAGPALERLVRFLVEHAASVGAVRAVRLSALGVLEVVDDGRAVPPALRDAAFTMGGQSVIKRDRDGRYARCAGLFAARLLADALGAGLELDGEDGAAITRVRLSIKGS